MALVLYTSFAMRAWLKIFRTTLAPELCEPCRRKVEKALADLGEVRRRTRRIAPIVRRQKALAETHCDLLLGFAPERQTANILNCKSRYRTRPMVLELLRRSRGLIRRDPVEACRLAELAECVARRILGMHEYAGGLQAVRDLQALSLAYQGNALRVQCRWQEAEDRFGEALGLLEAKKSELRIQIEVLSFHASFLKERRRFPEALKVLDRAEALAKVLDVRSLWGGLLLIRATIFQDQQRTEQSVQVLQMCTELLNENEDPRLLAVAYHNLASSLCEASLFLDALKALDRSDDLFGELGKRDRGSMDAFRVWTRGRITKGLDQVESAEEYFVAAKGAFLAQSNPFKAAQASLDLAVLYFDQGRLLDFSEVAEETYEALRSQELHPEAEHALLLFRRAAQRRQVALEVIRAAAEQLKRHQRCSGSALC